MTVSDALSKKILQIPLSKLLSYPDSDLISYLMESRKYARFEVYTVVKSRVRLYLSFNYI
jgi:hypothetical protein